MELIDGKQTAAIVKEELKVAVDKLKSEGKSVPGLVTIIVGNDPASEYM